jgi:predicted RNA-binding protein with PIN domain
MSLIIDGHNLIGVLPDIDLTDPNDEVDLLRRLRLYRARTGQALIVFFDSGVASSAIPRGSTPGLGSLNLSGPGLQVRFSAAGQTADDAIVAFLQSRAQPGQYAVVTNDQELSARVRAAGASLIKASDFASHLTRRMPQPETPSVDFTPDPHAPEFADIYAGFLESEKERGWFGEELHADPAIWLERLYGEDVELAQRAARWLGRYGGAAALASLRDALTHEDVRVRAAALLALGDTGDPAVVSDLCDRLINDPATMAREAAAQSLGRIGGRGAESFLETAARSDPKGKVRKAARAALTQIRARR